MALRQLGEPIDLYASVPKIGTIQPGKYMEALRQRFQPIAAQGEIANQLTQYEVMKKDAEAQQAAYDAAVQSRNSARDAVSNYQPPDLSLGAGAGGNGGSGVAGGRYTGAYVNPVSGYSPSGHWGSYPASGNEHNALDFAVPNNTRVGAPVSGKVVVAGWDSGGFGNSLRIQDSSGNYWILGHLNSLGVKAGDTVSAGQYVGRSGSTGRSTGPHLHLEARHSLWKPSSAFDFSALFGW
jgi:murein DD-endopeptidase MepM/ murein hydrolase activator NlpD